MGLAVDEFKILVKAMKAVYAQETFIPDNDAFKVWYNLLMDIDYKTLNSAVQRYMMTGKRPPTIADIREQAAYFQNQGYDYRMSDLEAWTLVRRAIGNSGYHQEEEFAKLPPLIQKAVGTSSSLHQWCMMDTETVDSVVQSQFLRSYRTALKRAEEDSHISPVLLERMSEVRASLETKEQPVIGIEVTDSSEDYRPTNTEYIDQLMRRHGLR